MEVHSNEGKVKGDKKLKGQKKNFESVRIDLC